MPTPVDVFCVFDWSDSVHFKAVTRVLVTWQKYKCVIHWGTEKTNIMAVCIQNQKTFWFHVCKWMQRLFLIKIIITSVLLVLPKGFLFQVKFVLPCYWAAFLKH
jgi:hypothetical protein